VPGAIQEGVPDRSEPLSQLWTTRFAPAPTGKLHLGHAVNAVWVWGAARAFGGRVILRIEDHDRIRSRPEHEAGILEDLAWLGLEADETVPRQSERDERYAGVLADLEARGLVYPCTCTRKEIQAVTGRRGGELRYPGTCRERGVDPEGTPIRRLHLPREEMTFHDLLLGARRQVPAEQCGDLLLRDRDGHWTYQLAVVVDDLDQNVDVVIRGRDLLASTGRQLQLRALLDPEATDREGPRFLHHRLVRDPGGRKLSKSDGDTGLSELRAAGWSPERVLGEAARLGGIVEEIGEKPALGLDEIARKMCEKPLPFSLS
jgi:glutamyl-tRNA synthetase/glutamyl-Q tRNA(Asp) synthetase